VHPPGNEGAPAAQAGVAARRALVARLQAAGVLRDARLADALVKVPRHLFVPAKLAAEAYGDHALPIGAGQTITQPANVVRSVELARIEGRDRVLEIGTGSGYQTALLSHLARWVFSLERIPELADGAKRLLAQLGVTNLSVHVFDGTYGWREHAPYDAIIVSAAAPDVPAPLVEQLRPAGRLVVPVGPPTGQRLLVVTRLPNGRTRTEDAGPAAYVPLVGRFGWGRPGAAAAP
jgi:protein-L-isoaspartate(D-aspartate) O-methyltransferase